MQAHPELKPSLILKMDRIRRKVSDKNGVQARNTQAARDALRRRQKEKKARIVKRHVRFKDKKKLMEQLEQSESKRPIVAAELSRHGEGEEESLEQAGIPRKKQEIPDTTEALKAKQGDRGSDAEHDGQESGDTKDKTQGDSPVKRKKYLPFTKEVREFERTKRERERRDQERKERIAGREEMLTQSRKRRGQKVSLMTIAYSLLLL